MEETRFFELEDKVNYILENVKNTKTLIFTNLDIVTKKNYTLNFSKSARDVSIEIGIKSKNEFTAKLLINNVVNKNSIGYDEVFRLNLPAKSNILEVVFLTGTVVDSLMIKVEGVNVK
ncbi:MAG: hypothetical protein RR454_03595 [Clostridia bacterium]